MTIKISIDCMGGDHGPAVTIPAALAFLKREPDAELILVGQEELVRAELKKHHAGENPRLTVRHASEVVAMDDPVEVALRRKKDSSMRVAIELVKDGSADVCVSAGNTGALMAISRYVLKTMADVDRRVLGRMSDLLRAIGDVVSGGFRIDLEALAGVGGRVLRVGRGSERRERQREKGELASFFHLIILLHGVG